jgi:hypothetical protein
MNVDGLSRWTTYNKLVKAHLRGVARSEASKITCRSEDAEGLDPVERVWVIVTL